MHAVILSGGTGSRLWPISNKHLPKPFIRIDNALSLIQHAFVRAHNINNITDIITVTNHHFIERTKSEYALLHNLKSRNITNHFIVEPDNKDTAAAITLSALYVLKQHGDLMVILPSDHLIANMKELNFAITQARELAQQGCIVTFGIPPNDANSNYGYIEAIGHDVRQFVEKPAESLAKQYAKNPNFFWNSGILCFSAHHLLSEMHKYNLQILETAKDCIDSSNITQHNFVELDSNSFKSIPKQSIDYAVMEKSSTIKMIPCNIEWQDIGAWDNFSTLFDTDSNKNTICGKNIIHNSSNCHIHSNNQTITAIGIKDLIIVSTQHDVLVANKKQTDIIKKIHNKLSPQESNLNITNHNEIHNHSNTQIFDWGFILYIETSSLLHIEQITINPNCGFVVDDYFYYAAHWHIKKGSVKFERNKEHTRLYTNQSIYIEPLYHNTNQQQSEPARKYYASNQSNDTASILRLRIC